MNYYYARAQYASPSSVFHQYAGTGQPIQVYHKDLGLLIGEVSSVYEDPMQPLNSYIMMGYYQKGSSVKNFAPLSPSDLSAPQPYQGPYPPPVTQPSQPGGWQTGGQPSGQPGGWQTGGQIPWWLLQQLLGGRPPRPRPPYYY